MITALYARVSTAGQEKEQTIDSQIAEIEARAKTDGHSIGGDLRFVDDGWSGSLLARPALDQLRDAVKAKSFEILYLYDLGRLSRDFLNQLILKKELAEAGIQIISLHDVNGSKPEDMFAQNVMGLFHDYERIKIAERFRRGKLHKSKNGVLFGWQAPYGYRYIKGVELNGGHFEIHEQESRVIKQIFSWVGNEGLTVRKVIKRLYDQGIKPRKSNNDYWATSTLSKRLRDETYIGTTYYNKTLSILPKNPRSVEKYKRISKSSRTMKMKDDWNAIQVPAIIDKGLFQKVQEQLVINDRFSMGNKKNHYLLSGIILCSCGNTRAGEGISGTQNLYYRCTDRVNRYPLSKLCFSKGVNAPILDGLAWGHLSTLLSNPNLIKKYYKRWTTEINSPITKTKNIEGVIASYIQSLTEQEKRYLKAYGSGAITLEQYKEQSAAIQLKIQAHTSKLSPQKKIVEEKPFVIPEFKAICDKMKAALDKKEFERRRLIIRRLGIKVITDGATATMTGKLPLEISSHAQKCQVKNSVSVSSDFQT